MIKTLDEWALDGFPHTMMMEFITQRNRQARKMMILMEVMKMLLVVGVEGMWSRVTFQSDLDQAGHRGHRPPILPDKILNTQHTRRPAKITRRATEENKQNISSRCVESGLCFYSFTKQCFSSIICTFFFDKCFTA